MSSAKKPLQVSVRMLLRGPSDRGGVLIRQRCTSRLRRWTWRLHRHTAGSDGGHLQEEAVVHDTHLSLVSGVTPSFGPSSRPDSTCSTRSLDEVAQAPDSCRQTTARISLSAETQATAQGSSKHRAMGPHFSSRLSSNEHGTRASWHATSGEARGETFNLQAQHHGRRFTLQAGTWEAQPVQEAVWAGSLQRWRSGFKRDHTSSSDSSETKDDSGSKESITVTFINRDGSEKTISVPVGTNMLQAAHDNDIDLEGACEGSLACSTCHVIFEDEAMYEKLDEPSEEENDMLDLAFGLTTTSRLGCQVVAAKELDGMRLRIPSSTDQGAVARLNVEAATRSSEGRRSRLGCQVVASKDLDGIRLRIPAATRNFAVDGFVPKPH